jgi:ABC-2 type transport system ATP-binding protein
MTYAIQFKHLSCKIANKTILHNINLEVETGSIVGILGPNGAGKSTLLSLVLGLRKQSSGELSVLQNSMPANASRIRPNLGVVLQETALYDEARCPDKRGALAPYA